MHIGTIIVCVGSSTVLATGSFGWQYNASNGVVFRRQIGTESCLYDHITFVYTFQHWQFFLCAYGSSKSRLAEGRAARVYCNSSTVPATGRSGGSTVPAQGRFRRQIGTESCRFRFICIAARGLSVGIVLDGTWLNNRYSNPASYLFESSVNNIVLRNRC